MLIKLNTKSFYERLFRFPRESNRFDLLVKNYNIYNNYNYNSKISSVFYCRYTTSCQTMKGESKAEFKRLPSTVTPINYNITLQPNLKSFTFTGSQSIKVKINEETKQIVLNALELEIKSASFTTNNGKCNSFENYYFLSTFLCFRLNIELYFMKLSFQSIIC